MANQMIRVKGKLVGQIIDQGNKIVILNSASKMCGYYDKSSNTTFSIKDGYVGKGNLLKMLL